MGLADFSGNCTALWDQFCSLVAAILGSLERSEFGSLECVELDSLDTVTGVSAEESHAARMSAVSGAAEKIARERFILFCLSLETSKSEAVGERQIR